ncbi:MAG: ATP-grasp domain-containing protein [Saprospiraceae bacterium]
MQRKILVFGGGDNQILLIKACRELSYYTIVTDPNPNAPGAALADLFVPLPPKDLEAHRNLILREQIEGIVTCQMENPLLLMASLAQEFNFRFPTPEVIKRSRNKYLMKKAFLQEQVPCAKGMLIENAEHFQSLNFAKWSFPLIIKPVDSFSSRGVFRLENKSELLHYYNESVKYASNGQVLIEEFLEGPEVSVESITFEGVTTVVQITDKVITAYPYTVEMAHYQPSILSKETQDCIKKIVTQAIDALGIDNTGSHAELKITAEGPKMIEIGARLGGDYISSYLTSLSTGVNMNRAIAQVAMGETPDLQATTHYHSGIQYINWEPGKAVKEIMSLDSMIQLDHVAHADITYKPGDILPQVTDSAKRHAFVISSGASRHELLNNLEQLSHQLSQLLITA